MYSSSGAERRQHPRKIISTEVRLSCLNDSALSQKVMLHDISLQGMAIILDGLSVNVGDKLCLCLSGQRADCGSEHLIESTVVNLHGGLAGLRFESVGIHILKDIQQLLREERKF